MIARLIFEDGTTFEGTAFTNDGEKTGEVVFNTALTGYQEVITDPSYSGQIVLMTYPLIGSYGINNTDLHFGLGWGLLNGSKHSFKNPLGSLDDSFFNRPIDFADNGGQFQPSRYFSGEPLTIT